MSMIFDEWLSSPRLSGVFLLLLHGFQAAMVTGFDIATRWAPFWNGYQLLSLSTGAVTVESIERMCH